MNDETKGGGMTLEQVRDDLRKEIEFQGQMGAYAATKVLSRYLRAINAYLAAQSAMRVDEDTKRDQRILIRLAWLENSCRLTLKSSQLTCVPPSASPNPNPSSRRMCDYASRNSLHALQCIGNG